MGRGAQRRSCPLAYGLLLYLTALNARPHSACERAGQSKVLNALRAKIAGGRGQRGGRCSEVKEEEERAQPGPGDMSGTFHPAGLGQN